MTITRLCELCNGEAKLYCESDSAYLCCSCDSNVHQANFLVARHIRRTICCKCKEYDGNVISGIQFYPILKSYTCSSCSSSTSSLDSLHDHNIIDVDSSSSSSSLDCFSAAGSHNQNKKKKKRNIKNIDLNKKHISAKVTCSSSVTDISCGDVSGSPVSVPGENSSFPVNLSGEESVRREDRRRRSLTKVDLKVEGILVSWCKKLGLKNTSTIIPLALHALRVCLENTKFLPFRVAIACSFWLALKFSSGKLVATCKNLKRLEEVCGVPVKTIVCAEGRISRVLNLKRRSDQWGDDLEEGSDEC